jgi:NADH-quinone oxidoreductase subunit L
LHQAQHHSAGQFDVQDIRNLGGLRKRLPFTFLAFVVFGAALAGMPFTSGSLSKEALILVQLFRSPDLHTKVIVAAIFTASFITVIYTFRLIWFVFFGVERSTKNLIVNEAPWVMRMPLALLMIFSVWLVYGLNPFSTQGWMFPWMQDDWIKFSHPYLALILTGWVAIAFGTAYLMYRKRSIPSHINVFQNALGIDWFTTLIATKVSFAAATTTDRIDRRLIDKGLHFIAYANVTIAHLTGWFDRYIIDGIVHTIAAIARGIGSFTRSFQSGKIQMYIFWAALALIIFIIWNLF